jgi:hypothetical protein
MLKNALYAILFGFAMEFQINILLHGSIGSMIGVIILYGLIGAATYHTVPYIMNRFNDAGKGFWYALTAHGLAGLLIIEWGFMGNTPWSVPLWLTPIAQAGMFSWWATIAVMPYVIHHPVMIPYKKKIFWYYGIYAVISTGLAIPLGMAPIILLEPPVYLGFFYFYKKFAQSLREHAQYPHLGKSSIISSE